MINRKIKIILTIAVFMLTWITFSVAVFAREGICGYEGGISSGEVAGQNVVEYQEVLFITGEPIVLKGTMTIKKQQRQGKTTTTYTYNLSNTEKDATLVRNLVFVTETEELENGQVSETTSLSKTPTETIRAGGKTYTLRRTNGYEFTRSNLIDKKPAANYHAGSVWSKKVYQVGNAADGNTVTVECQGRYYGYEQYWGYSEAILLDYIITSETYGNVNPDKWSGTASVAISSTSTERLVYEENAPSQISFPGGYVQIKENNSVLEYVSMLPEFDAKGISTDNIITYKDSLQMESFPTQKRLPAINISSIRGHRNEKELRMMFGLEAFKDGGFNFNPDHLMTRAEFVAALVKVAREVPADPTVSKTSLSTAKKRTAKEEIVSPFDDVSVNNVYFNEIKSAYDRGIISGNGQNLFSPNGFITKADAIVTFIRVLGFESMAPAPVAVTGFRDNDAIPAYARNAAYVARQIGILKADEKGNMNPMKKLTKAECAVLFKDLITYMQDGIKKDYRENLINY